MSPARLRPPPPLPRRRRCCHSRGDGDLPPPDSDASGSSDARDDSGEAARHAKRYSISGRGEGSAATVETSTGHAIRTDVPVEMGGGDSGPQPVEHLLAALIGCTQATATYVGRSMIPRLAIDRMDFDIRACRDERGALMRPIHELPSIPARLTRVDGTIRVNFKNKGTSVVTREQLRVLAEQTEARCPVANMMHSSGCVMEIEWTNGSDESQE